MEDFSLVKFREDPRGLTEREFMMVREFMNTDQVELTQDQQIQLFSLYASGYSITELCKTFPNYTPGQVQYARWRYNWDELRLEYVQELYESVKARLISTKLDSVNYLLDVLSIKHKKHEKEMKDFVADPENNPPPAFMDKMVSNAYDYKRIIETIDLILNGNKIDKTINVNHLITTNNKPDKDINTIDAEYKKHKEALLHGLLSGDIEVVDGEDDGE